MDQCKRGHYFTPENTLIQKPTNRRTCRACRQLSRKNYDPEKKRATAKRAYEKRQIMGKNAAYREANRQRINANHVEYVQQKKLEGIKYDSRPELIKVKNHKRRARLLALEYDSQLSWLSLWAEGIRNCALCGELIEFEAVGKWGPSLDHIVPLIAGGAHIRSNAQLTHRTCNSKKGVKLLEV